MSQEAPLLNISVDGGSMSHL